MSGDLIRRRDAIDVMYQLEAKDIETYGCFIPEGFHANQAVEALEALPSAEPKRTKGRKFLGIVVNYPKFCTYPEYKGKPYYSIKYEENGDMIVGFGTYKPEVLSQFLREYFISPAEPERKTGRWVLWNGPWSEYAKCTACGEMYDQDDLYIGGNDYPKFCPNCGADMRGSDE